MENMEIYEKVRAVPKEALKPINGGRLKGMSDINPMWRLKMLTEVFGVCGIGWKIEIVDKRLERGEGVEVVCFVDINLYVKVDGEWSAPIPGMGGSSFVTQEKNGPYTSDECFKMAYTDAISVACKSLGFAADIYFEKDRTKYTDQQDGHGSSAPVERRNNTQGGGRPNESKPLTDADLAAIEQQSNELSGKTTPPPSTTTTTTANYVTEGQSKMLYAKWKQSEYADLKQSEVCELLSAHLNKQIDELRHVEKADVNKVIKWLDDHRAAA